MDLAFDDDVIKIETLFGYRWIPLTVTRKFVVFFDLPVIVRMSLYNPRCLLEWYEGNFISYYIYC